jgi:ribosomal protein S18 acetylase RimI-like enzyme
VARRHVAASWIKPLAAALEPVAAFRGCGLRQAARDDEGRLFELHRDAMRDYVEATWGWDESWQRGFFAENYVPARHALIVRTEASSPAADSLIGRLCITSHWRHLFLHDIELVARERGRGLGTTILRAILALAASRRKGVELVVLKCNPARHLYERLGFVVIADDGARLTMRV